MNKLPIFHKASDSRMNFTKGVGDDYFYSLSLFFFILLLLSGFTVLVIRLFQLTIVQGDYYRRLSEENRIKEIIIEPKRGRILDRRGLTIADSQEPDLNQVKDRLTSRRIYTEPDATASLLGYRQLADQTDLQKHPCLTKPRLNDRVGKKGIEKIYECDLRGTAGKKLIELDAHGKYVKTLSVLKPTDGKTIRLALDLDLQKKAYGEMDHRRGAVIAMRPKTGEILTFLSTPTFNSQDFEDNKQESIKSFLEDQEKPLFNRITEGVYPPGSIIKPIIAIGALQDKKIDEKTIFVDEGKIKAGPLEFGNWYFLQYGKVEGPVDIVKAIRRSNDIFFYQAGNRLGPERIKAWSEKFGLGKTNSLPFDQEQGLIPTPFWKEETLHDRWYLGDSYNLSIGQGYFLVTPLQIAISTAAIANDGILCEPKLLKDAAPDCKKLNVSKKTLDLVHEGMRQACASGGTGWPLFDFRVNSNRIETGCKTGTAEAPGESGLPHAWFTVYAPARDPEIAITVLVENSGQGSDVAAPVAREMLKTYLERKM